MRLSSTRRYSWALALALVLSAALALSSPAFAANRFGAKVDDRVVQLADRAGGENAELRVIVFGTEVAGAAADAETRVRRSLRSIGGASMKVKAKHLERLARDSRVRLVAPDLPVAPTELSSSTTTAVTTTVNALSFPLLSTLYPGIDRAGAAWSRGYGGAGVGLAVIDSGVAAHSDFGDRLTQVVLPGQTVVDDAYGHGSLVAGVAAGRSSDGRYVGIAPEASVFGINVTGVDGGLYTSDVIAALDWVLANHEAHNIRVVNLSLSETVPTSYRTSALDTAVERLWRAGVVVVTSSGNLGPDTAVYAPANDPFVITVGAVDTRGTAATGDDFEASFSSNGRTQDGFDKPDLLAPGRRIATTLAPDSILAKTAPPANLVAPGYAEITGTSYAAPQVAGAVALLLEQRPSLTPDQVKWLLMSSGRSLSGSGRALDIAAAAAFDGAPDSANDGIAPGTYGLDTSSGDLTNASWNNASWNNASWNNASWNNASWNNASWNNLSWNFSTWE